MDEEQEKCYQSELSPKFHARDVAKWRCSYHKALLLLSSATPSVESFYQAQQGKYHLVTLRERYHGGHLPDVNIIDMSDQYGSVFSQQLILEIQANDPSAEPPGLSHHCKMLSVRTGGHLSQLFGGADLSCGQWTAHVPLLRPYTGLAGTVFCLPQRVDPLRWIWYPESGGGVKTALSLGFGPADGYGYYHVQRFLRKKILRLRQGRLRYYGGHPNGGKGS